MDDVTNDYLQEETETPIFVEGFALKGAEVKNSKDKTFEIIQDPIYEVFQDQTENKVKRRLKLHIKFNGADVTYFPNNSSQGKIIAAKGRRLADWVGFKGEFEVLAQKIGSETKDVIYIK